MRAIWRSIVATQRPTGSWCVSSKAEKCLANVERRFGQSQQNGWACRQSCRRAAPIKVRSNLARAAGANSDFDTIPTVLGVIYQVICALKAGLGLVVKRLSYRHSACT